MLDLFFCYEVAKRESVLNCQLTNASAFKFTSNFNLVRQEMCLKRCSGELSLKAGHNAQIAAS